MVRAFSSLLLARSSRFLVARKLSATDSAILLLQKKLDVEAVKKSDVITISFQHEDPEIAAQVVNKLVDRFIEYHVLVHQQPQSYGFFDEQVKLQSDQLKKFGERVTRHTGATKTLAPSRNSGNFC